MNGKRSSKLKKLLDEIPPGFIVDTAWLVNQGVADSSIYDYERRGWLERVTRAVYRRPFTMGDLEQAVLDWRPYILSLQSIMNYHVHVGGTSALALFGHIHYLPMSGENQLYLYADDYPAWLTRLPIDARIVTRKRSPLFGATELGIERRTPKSDDSGPDITVGALRWSVVASTPERAILEAINELPKHESFDNIDKLFEGLMTLRPGKLRELLNECRSVKVKRLFFVFADRHNHAWCKYLRPDEINLGSGPRALVQGGKLHPAYQIYVPHDFAPTQTKGDVNDH